MAKTLVAARSPLYYAKTPGGLASIVDIGKTPANVFYVDSGDSDASDTAGFGTHPDSPFATIDFAIGQCTANQGDIIVVLPGHAETISAGQGIDQDVAGISIIGVGRGDLRPTISLSATGSTWEVNADESYIENLLFIGTNSGGVTAAIDVKSGADDFHIKNCEFRETANTLELLVSITIEATIARVTIEDCYFSGIIGGDSLSAIFTEGACDDLRISGCRFNGDWLNAVMDLDATDILTPMIWDCAARQADPTNGFAVTLNSSCIASLWNCHFLTQKSNTVPVSDLSAAFLSEVYGTDVAASSAIIMPAAATAWT